MKLRPAPSVLVFLSAVAAVIVVSSIVAISASADGDSASQPNFAIDVSRPGTIPESNTAEDVAQAERKMSLAVEYRNVVFLGANTTDVVGRSHQYIAAKGPASINGSLRVAAAYWGYTLSTPQSPQINSYYCGPAAGYSILWWTGPSTSAYNGASLSQSHLGTSAHMNTDVKKATTWVSGRFRIGLNRWREGTDTGFYVDNPSPTATEFISALVFDIEHSYPFGADTVEFAGGFHYNNHPVNLTIGHWLTVHGYENYGDTAKFIDPSTSVWSAAKPYFKYDSAIFTNRFLQSNGITW